MTYSPLAVLREPESKLSLASHEEIDVTSSWDLSRKGILAIVDAKDGETMEQPQGLISVLNNTRSEFGDRHDAAMDLGTYDEPEAEEAIIKVILDATTDLELAETVGEKNDVNMEVLQKLGGDVLLVTVGTIAARRPEWKVRLESFGLMDRVKKIGAVSQE